MGDAPLPDPTLLGRQPSFFRARVMQRLPVPGDYGRAAVFLASDDMITGTDLRVDAGAIATKYPHAADLPQRIRTARLNALREWKRNSALNHRPLLPGERM